MENTFRSGRDRVCAPFRAPRRSFTTSSHHGVPWNSTHAPTTETSNHERMQSWLSREADPPLDDFGMITKPMCVFDLTIPRQGPPRRDINTIKPFRYKQSFES